MTPRYHSAKTILAPLKAMRAEGLSVGQVLAGTGLSLSILNRPEQRVSLSQELHFLRNLLKVTGNPAIGLHIGACYPLSLFGIYGYALMSAATMREAMQLAYQYVELSFAFFEHKLDIVDGVVFMQMDSEEYNEEDQPLLSDREMIATLMILRGLLGGQFKLAAAHLKHSPLGREKAYQEAFQCRVKFNAPINALEFDAAYLDTQLLQCDSDTAGLCIDRCERKKASLHEEYSVADEVRELLLKRPGHFPSIESLAKQMHITSRTLRRRLAQHNTGYQKIVDAVRFELAKEYLLGGDIGIEQIAMLLDYSDPAHFSNAFRRWAGCSPSQFRFSSGGLLCRQSEGFTPVQRL